MDCFQERVLERHSWRNQRTDSCPTEFSIECTGLAVNWQWLQNRKLFTNNFRVQYYFAWYENDDSSYVWKKAEVYVTCIRHIHNYRLFVQGPGLQISTLQPCTAVGSQWAWGLEKLCETSESMCISCYCILFKNIFVVDDPKYVLIAVRPTTSCKKRSKSGATQLSYIKLNLSESTIYIPCGLHLQLQKF